MTEEGRISVYRRIMNGDILRGKTARKYMGVAAIVILLLLVYIYAGFRTEQEYVQISRLQQELQDARNEELTISSQFSNSTRQSEVAKQLKEVGSALRESNTPIIVIK